MIHWASMPKAGDSSKHTSWLVILILTASPMIGLFGRMHKWTTNQLFGSMCVVLVACFIAFYLVARERVLGPGVASFALCLVILFNQWGRWQLEADDQDNQVRLGGRDSSTQ